MRIVMAEHGSSGAASKWLAVEKQVLHIGQGVHHTTTLEEQLEVLPILAVNQKRGRAINAFGHTRFELHQCFLVLAVEHTQFAVGLGLQVNIVAWFERLVGCVGFAAVSVLPIAGWGGGWH